MKPTALLHPAVLALLLPITGAGWAGSSHFISAEAGKDAPIGVYAVIRKDCSIGAAPDIRIIRAPVHGTIVLQDVQLATRLARPCAPLVAPARRVTYRPAAGFSGQEEVLFEIVNHDTGQSDPHTVTIVIRPAPTGI